MLEIFAAVAVAAPAAASPAPAPQTVEGVEITTRRPLTGTLQQGVQAYRPEFFTPVRPSNAMDMIKWLPGFTFEDVRDLRGLGGVVGNVLIDGKPPTSKTDTLSSVLARIPNDQVERVDIIVGGAPGIDMRGREVLANIVLKPTPKAKGVVSAAVFAMQDGRVFPEFLLTASKNAGGRSWETSLTLSNRAIVGTTFGRGDWVRTDGAGRVLFRADEVTEGENPLAVLTGAYEFPFAGGKLKVNGLGRYQHSLVDSFANQDDGLRTTMRGEDIFRQGELGLRYERTFAKRTTLEVQLLERQGRHTNEFSTRRPPVLTDFRVDDTQSEHVARSTLRFKKDDTFTVEGSAEGAFNGLTTDTTLLSAGAPVALPAADVRIREDRGEFGVLAQWKPNARYGLTAAMKVETSTLTSTGDVNLTRDFTYGKPRVTATWNPGKKTQVRLRGEREVGQVSFFNFVANTEFGTGIVRAGNPNLRPQKAWVAEGVVEQQFWTGASAVFTLRQRAVEDVVDIRFVGTSGAVAVGNIGDGVQTDAAVTVTLPLKAVGVNGAMVKATYQKSLARIDDPTTGERRRFSGVPRTLAELHFAYDLPQRKLNLGVDAFYVGKLRLYRPASWEGPEAWVRMVVFVEYRARPNLTARLEVNNVVDGGQKFTSAVYATVRDRSPLLYVDRHDPNTAPYAYLRLRRTF
jgi:hypothetical protein